MKKEMTPHGKYAFSVTELQTLGPDILDEVSDLYFPHYGLYHKEKGHQRVFCTHCREDFVLLKSIKDIYTERSCNFGTAKHGETGTCPWCGSVITYLADGKGRRKIEETRNFVVFHSVNEDELTARCIRIRQRFAHPDAGRYFADIDSQILEYSWDEVARYYFCKNGKPEKFEKDYYYDDGCWHPYWKERKNLNEPEFVHSMYMYSDNSYTVLNWECIKETSFRYFAELLESKMPNYNRGWTFQHKLMQIFADYCLHQQIEYIIKAGFGNIIESRMNHMMYGLRLNWRSNDLKKVLGLNAWEIKVLNGWDTEQISKYKELKKIDSKSTNQQISEMMQIIMIDKHTCYPFIKNLIQNRGETCKSILKYIKSSSGTLINWMDYLGQCERLRYDLSEPSVFKPSNLIAAHERCTLQIQLQENKKTAAKMKKRLKELEIYSYTDEKRNLIVRAARTTAEIIVEGKTLVHCVGGYAERHAEGKLTIVFIRKADSPDVPYFTMEVNTYGQIVQCHGYKNDRYTPKPQPIIELEKEYQEFLNEQFRKLQESKKSGRKFKKEKTA